MARSFDTFDLIEAQRRLMTLMEERPHLGARLTVREALQTYDQRAVFDIDWDGRRAIAKLIWHDKRAPAVSRQVAALRRIAERLAPPAFVPEVLHIAPKAGLFIIAYAAGETGYSLLKSKGKEAVAPVIEAAWLWQKAASAERNLAPLPQAQILRQIEALPRGLCDPLVSHLLDRLDTAPQEITQVPGHGDFWAGNLILDDGRITAIDLGPQGAMPLAKDLARFCRSVVEHGGIGLRDAAFAPLRRLLPEDEAQHLLPLYYGLELAQWMARLEDRAKAQPLIDDLLTS